MRFSLVLIAATGALAAPAIHSRSLVTELGNTVSQLDDGLGVTALEDSLDKILGGTLTKLEDALGVSFAEKLLHLSDSSAGPGVLQSVGEAVGMLLSGVGVPAVDKFLDDATGGAITSIEKALGVPDIEKALGLEKGF